MVEKQALTEQQQKWVVDRINDEIRRDPPSLELKVPARLPVWLETEKHKGYKTEAVSSGQEFLMKSVRFGKRDGLIALADPADHQEWEFAEFNQQRLEEWFPTRVQTMCAWLGAPNAQTLEEAIQVFVAETEREELALAAAAAQAERDRNKDNDLWGMF